MTADPKRRAVLALLRAELWPIPVWWPLPDGRCACGKTDCGASGKHPCIAWAEYQRRAPRPSEVHDWLDQFPECNWGVILGEASGTIAADLDGPGAEHLLLERGIELPESATALSARGAKVLLKHPGGRLQRKIALVKANGAAVDLLADGSQVVVPPSRHHTGKFYTWAIPLSAGIAVAPPALLELARASTRDAGGARQTTEPESRIPKGQRNTALTSLAGSLRHRGLDEAEIVAALLEVNARRCDPPLPEQEVRVIAASVCRYPPAEDPTSEPPHRTDLGNARRLVVRHQEDLRYCFPWGKWLVWDDRRWTEDDGGEVFRRSKETVAAMYVEAAALADEKARAALATHALKSEADGKIRAMLSLARSEPGIPVVPRELDADPWLLNVLNGTLDLRTGQLRPHRREDYITKVSPVVFDPAGVCPTWERFLAEVFPGRPEVVRFLQKGIGYSLTGDTREQCLFFLHGLGANGKTTLLRTIQEMLSDYAKQAPPDLLLVKHGGEHPTGLADLAGARLVVCIEASEGKRLAEALVKQLVGTDRVKARRMREDFWEFTPTHKIWLAANHKPRIRGTDYAIWRRIRLVPFTVTFWPADGEGEPKQDPGLPERLRAELPGILRWAVDGCLAWQQEGLAPPEEVRAATAEYRAESDTLGAFLEERCVLGPTEWVAAGELFRAYLDWCKSNGENPLGQTAFGTRLTERGFPAGRTPSGSTSRMRKNALRSLRKSPRSG